MEHEGPCGLDQRDGFSLIRVGSHFYPEIQHQTPGTQYFLLPTSFFSPHPLNVSFSCPICPTISPTISSA